MLAPSAMHANVYMSTPVVSVRPEDSLEEAHRLMRRHQISSVAVIDDGELLVGVITRTDLLRVGRREAGGFRDAQLLSFPPRPVADLMTREVLTIDEETGIRAAAAKLVERHVHRLFVCRAGSPVGVLSTRDLMVAIRAARLNAPISDYMSSPLFTVRAEEPVSLATDRLEKAHVRGVVVLDGEWPIGVFTQVEALAAKDAPRDTAVEEVMSPAMLCLPIDTPMHRAAAQASATRARRVIAVDRRTAQGILTGFDFARAAV
jgi:CBS domain-containing protein